MGPKTYLSVTSALVLLLLVSYLRFVDAVVLSPRQLPSWYPQFLLESATSVRGKVVVESGSNSQHAIAPSILAGHFGGPVIIVSINAGYPLLPKIHNLARHVGEGDVVILPLEWNQYAQDGVLPSAYLKDITKLTHFYEALPTWDKARFLLQQYPIANLLASIRTPADRPEQGRKRMADYDSFSALIQSGNRRAFGGANISPKPTGEAAEDIRTPAARKKSCDYYLFGNQIRRTGFIVSNEFRRALARVRLITERGAQVYFTWPAVVDHESSACYQDETYLPKIEAYAKSIRSVVEEAGYTFVGDFRDSHFPPECFIDTYYHIAEACAHKHTQQLLQGLVQAGAMPTQSNVSAVSFLDMAQARLELLRLEAIHSKVNQLPAVKQVLPADFDSKLLLSDGWSGSESWGVWSTGSQSSLALRVESELLGRSTFTVRLRGQYFNGSEATRVTINGREFGHHVLLDKSFNVPVELLDGDILYLDLGHINPVSSYELGGGGKDKRKLKYGFMEIDLQETDG